MLFSYNWLKEYFNQELPEPKKLAELITLSAYQVEEILEKDGDFIFNVDVLPNRSHDSFCMNGFARQVGSILNLPCKESFSPEIQPDFESHLSVQIEDYAHFRYDAKECHRYVSREIRRIKVEDSPLELKKKIEALGQRSINNLVDIVNLVMLETNEPMHVFDSDKISGKNIKVRLAENGEVLTTLDGNKLDLNENDLIIADEKEPIALAGIKGGQKAEIDQNTKNILLEAANFNQTKIRLTSSRLGVKTESSRRFESGLSPELAMLAIHRVSELIKKYASDEKTKFGNISDQYPRKPKPYKVGISIQELSDIAGLEFKQEQVEEILNRLNFKFEKVQVQEKVLETAKSLLGVPYKYSSSVTYDSPREFDCSTFVAYVFSEAGVGLPRMAIDQFVYSEKISKEDLVPGDLIFANSLELVNKIDYESIEFLKGTEVEQGVDHVGIYIGDDEVIHTSRHNENGVEIQKLAMAKQFEDIIGYRRAIDIKQIRYVVEIPPERLDIRIKEDLAEEIMLLFGYQNIPEKNLDEILVEPKINLELALIQKIKTKLIEKGFSEIITYSLVSEGEIEVLKPVSPEKSFLRTNLFENIKKSLEFNSRRIDLVGMKNVLTFEIGKVFSRQSEDLRLAIGAVSFGNKTSKETKKKLAEAEKIIASISEDIEKISFDDSCLEFSLQKAIGSFVDQEYSFNQKIKNPNYKNLSTYPFIFRDISLWAESETKPEEIEKIIRKYAGQLLWRITLFDVFEKNDEDGQKKISLTFRIVFQSQEKTLTDQEIMPITNKIYSALKKNGYVIR